MKQKSILFLSLIFILLSCESETIPQRRAKNIKALLRAIKNDDRRQIYSVMDTTILFSTRGEEYFTYLTSRIRKGLKDCDSPIVDSLFDIYFDTVHNSIKYKYSFCFENGIHNQDRGFDLIFTFSPYDEAQMIQVLEKVDYRIIEPKVVKLPY